MINVMNFQLESKDSVFCCNRKEKKEFNFIFIKKGRGRLWGEGLINRN